MMKQDFDDIAIGVVCLIILLKHYGFWQKKVFFLTASVIVNADCRYVQLRRLEFNMFNNVYYLSRRGWETLTTGSKSPSPVPRVFEEAICKAYADFIPFPFEMDELPE